MVKHLDDSVGSILRTLEETGLDENTMVVFSSDNGGVEYTSPPATDNFPFKGGKACLHEGGVRVPLVFSQAGKFDQGLWCDAPVNCIDLLPTFGAITGNEIPAAVDGESLLGLLSDPDQKPADRTFYWHYPFNVIVKHPDNGFPLSPHSAIRVGDEKLIWDWHGTLGLYDIAADPFEQHDLSASEPERANQLFGKLKTWLRNNVRRRYLPTRNRDYDASRDRRGPLVNRWD
jgi:arylsulfatase A-like enzyme